MFFTVPSATQLLARLRLQGHSDQLVTDLRLLRVMAVARNKTIYFKAQSPDSQRSCYLIFMGTGSSACHCLPQQTVQCDNASVLLKSQWFDRQDGVVVSANQTLSFAPHELSTSAAATVLLRNQQAQQIEHRVTMTGRVRRCVSEGHMGGFKPCETRDDG